MLPFPSFDRDIEGKPKQVAEVRAESDGVAIGVVVEVQQPECHQTDEATHRETTASTTAISACKRSMRQSFAGSRNIGP